MASESDLVEFIDFKQSECLNAAESDKRPWENVLKQGPRSMDTLLLSSECDEQLLLNIAFNQKVKITAIRIRGVDANTSPKTVKLFVNKTRFDFDDVQSNPPAQVIQTTSQDVTTKLKLLSFQSTDSLTIFVENNLGGGEVTQVCEIVLFGSSVATTNMSELKKIDEH
eukprot:c3582_g1_i1.p1 GENE.c3582_g1_i1~~c3582_g1_i1.p1  ORF type:complete len:175 (+),score=25.10 c3582_g1_i1:23-526(+)